MEIIETIALIGFMTFMSYLLWIDCSANAKLRQEIFMLIEEAKLIIENKK